MPVYIEMPKLSDTMTEGTLVRWHIKIGDKVQIGQIIADVETDKATMEMEAFEEGIVYQFLIAEGSKVKIGEKLAVLLEEGEAPPSGGDASPAALQAAARKASTQPSQSSQTPISSSQTIPQQSPDSQPKNTSARVKASPLARKIAAAKGIDLSTVQGTGPGGRILATDIEAAAEKLTTLPPVSASSAPLTPSLIRPDSAAGEGKSIPLTGMRRVIAERLLASKTQIPHFYLHAEIDASPISKLRRQLNQIAENSDGSKVTINDFILLATARAAAANPKVNASFTNEAIIQYSEVNLAVAVAIEEGLVTPVIRSAQKLTLRQISDAVKDLASRARSKKLKPEEYQGGTITVSNLGAYGVERFEAIINPPQAVIVAVGAIVKKPVVNENDEIVPGERMSISLSCDHRVIDGAIGAEFLSTLRRLLENPALMLF
ncbi:MAG: pyruvate dehydrogenase complex dihydrolipoamide acetyltransferase [Chthoniobacterales bacterium]|nr:pyruvate dehydrogenase complex dihydrolipoamide acetyltransferase [Chthoniobacterales bacterium]